MKTNSTSRIRIVSLLLAIIMAVGLTACGSNVNVDTGTDAPVIEDTGTLPDAYGIPRGNSGRTSRIPRGNQGKPMYTDEEILQRYGEIKTLTKSVKTPSKPDTKNTKVDNSYGTVDWSTAANGYITFTAKGQTREFILQGPNGAQALATVDKGDSAKIALTDSTGKYQYAIANLTDNGQSYSVQYKNSFQVKSIDTDLAPYLVSTAWGDYENAPNAVAKAEELWDSQKNQLENVKALYQFIDDLDYNMKLKHGTIDKYVNPDDVIERGGGVCNDLSKLLVAMLRSQGVPAYYQSGLSAAGTNHAWVVAWVELSDSTKDGVTSSKGAWVVIEATGSGLQPKVSAKNNYNTEDNNYSN